MVFLNSDEKVLCSIPSLMQLKGPINPFFNLYFTERRIVGTKLEKGKIPQFLTTSTDASKIDEIVRENPKDNFSLEYGIVKSVNLHKHSFWATGTGKTISISDPTRNWTFTLSFQQYEKLKNILPNLSGLIGKLKF
jgi:hypothetical protein